MNEEMLNHIYNQLFKDKVDYDTFKKDMSSNIDAVNATYDKLGLAQKGVLKTKYYSDLGLTPNREKGSLNDYMFQLESKALGGYKAYNGRGGGQGAVGGYQHRYDTHKDEIAKITGVTNRDEFYNNPFAQEQFQNHLVETQYKPHLPVLRQIAKNKGLNYNDTELMYIEHHEGFGGAKTFLLSGNSQFGSENKIANRLKEGKEYFKATGSTDDSIQQSIGNIKPKQQILKTLNQKVEKIYKDKSKQASLYLWKADTKEGVRKKVYDEAFANGDLNPNDFTEQEFNELYGEKDYTSSRKRLAQKSKERLNKQLKDQGLFESLGDVVARYNPALTPNGTLDTKNGKINIGLGTPLTGKPSPVLYATPDEIMKLKYHPLGGNDPNSRENLHLRNIQSIISESDRLNKLADSNGLEHKLKATVDYKDNLKNKIINKGYKSQFKEFESLLQSQDQSEENKQKLQGLYQELSAVPEFEQYYKSVEELGKMKSQFDAIDNKYVRAKAFEVLENSRHIANDKYRRSLSNSAAILKTFEDVILNTGKKAINMPTDVLKFAGNIVEGAAQGKLGSNVTDMLIAEAESDIQALKSSKEQDGVLTQKVRFEKNGKVFYGKVNDKGEIEDIYDDEGYKVNFNTETAKQNAIDLAKKQYDKYGSETDFNWTALGSGVKDTAPDLINMVLVGGIIKSGTSALASGSTRLSRLGKLATNPRILEASTVIPTFAAQTARSNIKEGKLATPGEIAISTSKDLALEMVAESLFAGPIGKMLGDKVTKETLLNITKSRTKDLVDNLITGKLSKAQFAKEFGKSIKELATDMLGEGVEETFTDIAKPLTDDLLNGLLDTSFDTELPSLEELGSTFLVGAAAGGLMGGVNFAGNVSNIKTNVQDYYKDLLKSSIANVNNGKVATATVENPLLFSKHIDQLVQDGEYSSENAEVLKSSVSYAHEQSKHLFNENPEIELSDDVKSLYTTSAFNSSYFEAIANRKKLINEEQSAISTAKAEEYSQLAKFNSKIKNELDVNIDNKINSPVTPTHVLNKIGLKLSDEELKTLEDKHKSIAKELSTNKGTDQQKSALLSNKLLQGIKDIVNSRKKEDPKKEEDTSKIPDNLKENEADIKNDIKTEVKTPDQKVDERVENPEQFDEQDEIKKELLLNLQEDLNRAENDDDYDIIRSEPLYKGKEYQDLINKHQQSKKLDKGLEQSGDIAIPVDNVTAQQITKEEIDLLPNQEFDPVVQKQLLDEIDTSGYTQEELDDLQKQREEIVKELNSIPLPDEDPTINEELKEKRRKEAEERETLRKQQLEVFNEREANRVASPITSVLTPQTDNNIMGITPGYVTNQKYKLQFVYKDGTTSTIDVDRDVVEKAGDKSLVNFAYIISLSKSNKEVDYYHIIPNGSEKNLKSKEAEIVISKLEPGSTVYYEIDVNDEYNLQQAGENTLNSNNIVIDVVAYVDQNNNPIPKSDTAKKVYIAKIPANNDSNLNVKTLRDNSWKVFQDIIKDNPSLEVVEIGSTTVDKTHSIPNVKYGNGSNPNTRRNVLPNEVNNPDLYIVGLNHNEQAQPVIESNGRTRLANAIIINGDGSLIPDFPIPISWLGGLIAKVGNKFIKFDTKKVKEVPALSNRLLDLLTKIQDEVEKNENFNPYEEYKEYWTSIIGLNPKDTSAAIFRYRSNISNIDADDKQGTIVNPRGGIAPLIFYTKGKGFTVNEGALKKEYLSLNQVYDLLIENKIHIDAKKLTKDNFNSREALQYRKEIQEYLTTNYKEPTPTQTYFINQTVILNNNTNFVKTTEPVSSSAIPVVEKPKATRKTRFKVSNKQSLEPLKNPTLNDNIMWFKERFKEVGISVDDEALEVIAKIQNVGDRKLWGAFHNAAVILSSDTNSKVTRHEAFHVLFNLFLNDDQRIQILDEAFEKFGTELGITKEAYEEAKKQNKAKDILFKVENNEVNYVLKAVDILQSNEGKKIFDKGIKNNWSLDKILTELQIPKDQKQLILDLQDPTKARLIPKGYFEKDLREQIITDLLANYSYTVEINTSTGISKSTNQSLQYYYDLYQEGSISKEEYDSYKKQTPTQYYSNLTVPGGTNYTENEIATPAITPSIKGHSAFSTDSGIGWFRSDEKVKDGTQPTLSKEEALQRSLNDDNFLPFDTDNTGGIPTKTRRILEVQSDLFQKGRDKEDLFTKGGIYYINKKLDYSTNSEYFQVKRQENHDEIIAVFNTQKEAQDFIQEQKNINKTNKENKFLQLLNKDNNWVTFFVKSIIQDSAKKGYEKVLFPKLDTIIQIESEGKFKTYEEAEKFYKTPEWIVKNDKAKKELDEAKALTEQSERFIEVSKYSTYNFKEWKNNAVQRAYENWHSLQPSLLNTAKFYENDITNILKKQGYNPTLITDEYGNTWNEVTINPIRDDSAIRLKSEQDEYYKSQGPLIQLEEKLAELYEEYKEDLGLFSSKYKTKYPKITKFIEDLYKFMFNNYQILRSYFTDRVTIESLFYELDNNIYGKNFIGNRKKSTKELFNRNLKNFGEIRNKISNWTSENTERYASFVNKDLMDVYLRKIYSERYPDKPLITPSINQLVNKDNPLGILLKNYYDNIEQHLIEYINELTEEGVELDENLLKDINYQFKTSKNFKKLTLYSLLKDRGISIQTTDEDFDLDEETGEVEIFNDQAEGWMKNVFKQNPTESLSGEVKEFLARIVKLDNDGNPQYDTDTGQYQYYSLKETHSKLLNNISDSSNIETFVNRFNELIQEFSWAKELIKQIYGPEIISERELNGYALSIEDFLYNDEGVLPIDTFSKGSILRSIYSSIGDLRNVDFRTLQKENNGSIVMLQSNRQNIIENKENTAKNYFKKSYFIDNNTKLQSNFNIEKIKDLLNSKDITHNDLKNLLNLMGFFTSDQTIVSIFDNKKDLRLVKELLLGFVNNTELELSKSSKDLTKILNQEVRNVLISFKGNDGKNSNTKNPFKGLSSIIVKHDMTEEIRSIYTVKKEKRYNHVYNNYLSREMEMLNQDSAKWANERMNFDGIPVLFHSKLDWYKTLGKTKDFFYYIGTTDKSKPSADGIEYGDMFVSDIQATNFNIWISSKGYKNKDSRYYSMPVFSDATNKAYIEDATMNVNTEKGLESFKEAYVSIALAEFDRINYLRTNKEIDPNFKSGYNYLDKNGYNFFMLPYLNDLGYDLSDSAIREKMIINVDGEIKFNPVIEKEIGDAIEKHLSNEFSIYINRMLDTGLLEMKEVNGNVKYSVPKNSKLSKNADIDSLKNYFFNQSYYYNVYAAVFGGDIAHYKSMVEQQKRFKQTDAPNQNGLWEKSHNKVLLLKDIEVPTPIDTVEKLIKDLEISPIIVNELRKNLSSNNITDAGTFHTLKRRKEYMKAFDLYKPEIHDGIFDKLSKGKKLNNNEYYEVFGPLKPFYYGLLNEKDSLEITSHLVPVQGKNAEILLLPSLAYLTKDNKVVFPNNKTNFDNYQYPDLAKLLHIMDQNDIGTTMFESAFKASAFKFNEFTTLDTSIALTDDNIVSLPNKFWGTQQVVPEKSEDAAARIGSQIRKIITGDLDPNIKLNINVTEEEITEAIKNLSDSEISMFKNLFNAIVNNKVDSSNIKDVYELLLHLDISDKLKKIEKEHNSKESLINYLETKTLEDSPSLQTLESFEVQPDGYTLVPLEVASKKNEKLLNSVYKKTVALKRLGAALVNSSSFGFINRDNTEEDQLQIKYKYDENGKIIGIDYIEAAVPANYGFLNEYVDENGNVDIEKVPEELRYGIFYRIPTEGKYSIFPIKITKILPKSSGGQIILPREATTIAGLDFDVDKLYGFFKYPDRNKDIINESINVIREEFGKFDLEYSEDDYKDILDDILSNNMEVLLSSPASHIIKEIIPRLVTINNSKKENITKALKSGLATAEQRHNMMIDLMFGITQSKEFAKDFFNIGSKKQLETALEDLTKKYNLESDSSIKSITDLNTQERVSASNIVGKRLIGIFANSNAFHNLIQKNSVSLSGPTIEVLGKTYSNLNDLVDSVGQKVSKNLSILLFASTEDTKNPVLAPLNINMYTASLATTLIRYGVSLRDTLEMLNSETIRKITNIAANNSMSDLSAGLKKYVADNPQLKDWEARYDYSISTDRNSIDYVHHNLKPEEIEAVLEIKNISTILNVSRDLLLLDLATKSDTGNVGPDIADVISQLERIFSVKKKIKKGDFLVNGAEVLLPSLSKNLEKQEYKIVSYGNILQINSFVKILIAELNNLKNVFYHLNPRFDIIRKEIAEYRNEKSLKSEHITYVNNEVYNAIIQKDLNKQGINYHEFMINFPEEFVNSTILNQDKYSSIKELFIVNEEQEIPVIELVQNISFTEASTIRSLFDDMILGGNKEELKLATDLMLYSILTSLNYKKNTFMGVIPPSFYKTKIGSYVRGILNGSNNALNNYSTAEMNALANLIFKSNFSKFVPRLTDDDYILQQQGDNYILIAKNNSNFNGWSPSTYIYVRREVDGITKPMLYRLIDSPRNKSAYELIPTPFNTLFIKDYTNRTITIDGKTVSASVLFEEKAKLNKDNLRKKREAITNENDAFAHLKATDDPFLKRQNIAPKSGNELFDSLPQFNQSDFEVEPPIEFNEKDLCKPTDIDIKNDKKTGETI